MNLEELDATLPNGFHDAFLLRLDIDYTARTARMHLNVWTGSADSPAHLERESRRPAILHLDRLLFCSIGAPDATYPYVEQPWLSEALPVNPPTPLPAGAFESKFFVPQWNSFIHVAAFDASLEWLDQSPQSGG